MKESSQRFFLAEERTLPFPPFIDLQRTFQHFFKKKVQWRIDRYPSREGLVFQNNKIRNDNTVRIELNGDASSQHLGITNISHANRFVV